MNPQNNINSINNQNQSSCQEDLKKIYYSMPLFIRFVVTSTVILYLLNLFIPLISLYFSNIPYFIIFKFQLWRLFTNAFITTSIFSIIFAFMSWIKDASNLETNIGTMKYMMIFMVNSILIQFIEMTILLVIYLIANRQERILALNYNLGYVENDGLWPIIMAELTLLCLCNPEIEMRFLFLPCVIKAKYYPFILVGFFTLLNQFRPNFGVLSGVFYGFIYHKYLKNILVVSDNFINKLENCFIFKWMTKMKGYVKCGNNQVQNISISVETNNNDNYSTNNNNNNNNKRGFVAFSGKGVTVGSSQSSSNNTSMNSDGYQNITQDSI